MTETTSAKSYYPVRTELVNRKAEMALIHDAIVGKERRIVYFKGAGGIGKTRLLEEVLNARGSYPLLRCSDLIDLFHEQFHTPDNIQLFIADKIDPQNYFFQQYRIYRKDLLSNEEKGVERDKLKELAKKRDAQFLTDYRAVVEIGLGRVLLLFDTTEQIQRESETVRELLGAETQYQATFSWLISEAPKLPNTVIVLAGRPKPEIETQICTAFGNQGWRVDEKDLEAFNLTDTCLYIDALLIGSPLAVPLTDEEKDWLFRITDGKPIRLALAFQFINYESIDTLRAGLAGSEPGQEGLTEELDRLLITHLINLPGEFGGAMHFMMLARNGMDRALLEYLTHWDAHTIDSYFEAMKTNVLFKVRDDNIYLHDELYELHDRHYRNDPFTTRAYETIAGYYRGLIAQEKNYRSQQDLRIKALFYELQCNTEKGYQLFARWDEEVIWLHFMGADQRLQDQLMAFANRYLRPGSKFFDQVRADQISVDIIDCDSAIRCVERAITDRNFGEAVDLAEAVLREQNSILATRVAKDGLYQARIVYALAESRLYLGATREARQGLDEAIRILDQCNPVGDQVFWKQRTLARAYNRYGYYYRMRGHYSRSIPLYRRAIGLFKGDPDLRYMRAQTLTNQAFILAQTGDTETAQANVKEAREIWKEFGMSYRFALTLSALCRILVEADRLPEALEEVREAQKLASQIDDLEINVRLMISEGRVRRKQGNEWKSGLTAHPKEKAHDYLSEGENILLKAENLASEKIQVLDRWEIYNELGSLYCDWAWLHRAQHNATRADTCYLQSIKHHEQAIEVVLKSAPPFPPVRNDQDLDGSHRSNMPFQLADSYDDLAQAHGDYAFFLMGGNNRAGGLAELEKGKNALTGAEQTVPPEYRQVEKVIQEFTKPTQSGMDGSPFWLVLGKANLWRGVWAFRLLQEDKLLHMVNLPGDTERVEKLRQDLQQGSITQEEFQNKIAGIEGYGARIEEAIDYLLTSQVYFWHYGETSSQINRNMRYLVQFIKTLDAPYAWMEPRIEKVEKKFQTSLALARNRLQNQLGG